MSKISIIGVKKVDGEIVLTDAAGEEYGCSDAEELWADLNSILDDDELPTTDDPNTSIARNGPEDVGEVGGVVCSQVDTMVSDRYGALAGRGAAEVTRRLTPTVLGLLRRVSSVKRFE